MAQNVNINEILNLNKFPTHIQRKIAWGALRELFALKLLPKDGHDTNDLIRALIKGVENTQGEFGKNSHALRVILDIHFSMKHSAYDLSEYLPEYRGPVEDLVAWYAAE